MSDHEPVPDEVWEQAVSNGGEVAGDLPATAAAVIVQGVAHVREVPALRHNAGAVTVGAGDVFSLGREPHRRRLLLSVRAVDQEATPAPYVVAGDSADQARAGFGLSLPPDGRPTALHTADRLYLTAVGGAVVLSWLAELDQG